MIKSRLCDMTGIKYPIIQAGMGPFSNNNLGVAAANAGTLGLFSTSGLCNKDFLPFIYKDCIKSAEANPDDDIPTAIEKLLKRSYRLTKDTNGVFGINVMVSAELLFQAELIINSSIQVVKANPGMEKIFKVFLK